MLYSRLESIGSFLPETIVSNETLVDMLSHPGVVDAEKIHRVSGVRERRVCDQSSLFGNDSDRLENGLFMAIAAAQDALSRSRYQADDLDIVISCSIFRTRDDRLLTFEPSFALTIKNAIGAENAIHFDISNACAGMLTAVAIIDGLIRSNTVRRGLIVSGENSSLVCESAVREIFEKYDLQFASLTIGDAGSAVILEAVDEEEGVFEDIKMVTNAEYAELCVAMPSERGTGISMYTDNRSMQSESRCLMWTCVQKELLSTQNSDFESEKFDFIIYHQFSGPVLEFAHEIMGPREFGVEMPPSLTVLEEYGNTASTSHFVVLHEYLKQGLVYPGAKVLMVPAASGIVVGCVSLTLGSLQI